MRFSLATAAVMFAGAVALGSPATIQPNEADSKDAFIYEFLPTFNFDSGGFGVLLSSGATGVGHDTQSLLQFDLTGKTLGIGETATLNLWVADSAASGFGVGPSAANPVTAEVHCNLASWDESTIAWGNRPAYGSTIIASKSISGINQWVSFDVTSLVQAWLGNPSTNFGFTILQPAAVGNGQIVAVYDSASGTNHPYLQIVPEPAMAGCLAIFAALLKRRRIV